MCSTALSSRNWETASRSSAQGDKKDVKEHSKAATQQEQERQEFRKEYRVKKRIIRGASGKEKAAKAKRELAKAYKVKKFPVGLLAQKTVQAFAPPKAHTWRSAQGSWQIHLKPWPRKSRSWALEGEEEAARFVLKYAWIKFLKNANLDSKDCPFSGLLGMDEV